MNLWQIAVKNVWQNRNRYLAYLASSAFSVMIYFLYSSLVYHPRLQGGYYHAATAVEGMRAAAIVIAIFTFLFLLYSSSAFIRSRMKEFGLLSLLGVSKGQLIRIILGESVIIASIALATGLGLGLLFQKLFFMAISVLLQLPEQLSLYVGTRVWVQTIAVFGTFFLLVSLTSLRSVTHRNTIELIRSRRQPKAAPTFSKWKTLLGLFLVGTGYVWASIPHPVIVVLGVIPVTLIVSVGTYFLLREGSIALLSRLHRRERFFYRPGPFLTISQLVYKIQDNYRVLTAVAILVAVILSAVGTVFSFYVTVVNDTVITTPRAFQLMQRGTDNPVLAVEQVDAVLRQHGLTDFSYRSFTTLIAHVKAPQGDYTVYMVPYSYYCEIRNLKGQETLPNREGEVILVAPHMSKAQQPTPTQLTIDSKNLPVSMYYDTTSRILNSGRNVLVIPDAMLKILVHEAPADQQIHISTWDVAAWKSPQGQTAAADLRQHYKNDGYPALSTTVEMYRGTLSDMGLLLFIGVFVSLVFFAASCSLLYFRLFTEIDDDRKYFRQLQQVGLSSQELKRLASHQATVVFFTPFIIGLIHSTFAMQALGTLMERTVLQLGWTVALAYLVLYSLYFAATYAFYWRTLRVGLIEHQGLAGA